jgi:hypothetical protein
LQFPFFCINTGNLAAAAASIVRRPRKRGESGRKRRGRSGRRKKRRLLPRSKRRSRRRMSQARLVIFNVFA